MPASVAIAITSVMSTSDHVIASTVETVTWSLIDPSDLVASSTLNALSFLQTPAGGYKRLEGSTDPYDTNEWILIDLRASAAFRKTGNGPKADSLLDWVTAQASVNNNLLPELYNTRTQDGPIGAYAGSIPMVGYGAGAYLVTLLDRAGLYEHADCGDKDIGDYPDAGPIIGGHDGGPGGNGISGERTGIACACSGGPGAPATGVLLVLVGALVLARRRR